MGRTARRRSMSTLFNMVTLYHTEHGDTCPCLREPITSWHSDSRSFLKILLLREVTHGNFPPVGDRIGRCRLRVS